MTICERMFGVLEGREDISAYGLCKHLGIGTSTTTTWKKRNTDPPANLICGICEYIGVPVEWLLTGEGPEDPGDPGEKEKAPAPVLDDRTRELVEIFSSLDDFDKGQVLGTARTLWAATEKKGGMMPGGIAG